MTIEEIKAQTDESIVTEHNTVAGTMTQHFGDDSVTIVTDTLLKCIGYFISGRLIHFIEKGSEKQLLELQQAGYIYYKATH